MIGAPPGGILLPGAYDFPLLGYSERRDSWAIASVLGQDAELEHIVFARLRILHGPQAGRMLYVAQRPGEPLRPRGYSVNDFATYQALLRDAVRLSPLPYVYAGCGGSVEQRLYRVPLSCLELDDAA